MIVRCRTNDLVFSDQRVTRILRLRNLQGINLYRFAFVGSQLILYAVRDVSNEVSTQQETRIPTVKNDHTAIFSRSPETCMSSENEPRGQRTKQSHENS